MNRFRTCALIDTSRAATDSSHTRKSGCTASARAMPMRARCPPGNRCGGGGLYSGIEPPACEQRLAVPVDLSLGDDAVHDRRLADDVAHPGSSPACGMCVNTR